MKNTEIKLTITSEGATVATIARVNVGDVHLPFEHAAQQYLKPLWEQAQKEFFFQRDEAEKAALAKADARRS
jgi:hypothetical protein